MESPLEIERVPAGVRAILEALLGAGFEACLVGGCVRDLLRAARVRDFDVATSAPSEAILRLFPRAVPIGLRHGTVMVPTAEGPVDVTTYRAGPRLEDDLALRDLTVNAMAWDARRREIVDPAGGRADLAARCLRPVGSARARFGEDPVRAVRAARLAAQLGFELDPSLEPAMAEAREPLRRVARERIRRELEALLVAPHADVGLLLLRRAGIEADLVPGAAADAPRVVAALPRALLPRLAAWLRGTSAESLLQKLRFPRATARRVEQIVRMHPVELGADPTRLSDVRRLLRRAGEEDLATLLALREAELAGSDAGEAAARERLAALRVALDRLRAEGAQALRRRDLALDGGDVMRLLSSGPGRHVGEALDFLAERVLEDPACNTPQRLGELLQRWAGARVAPPGESRI